MSADNELFELCKEVYERTGWRTDHVIYAVGSSDSAPAYTSDYLLEKLKSKNVRLERIYPWDNSEPWWGADERQSSLYLTSDTPLKALLKLTIALHEAGELK